jgi:hypothetical protein
LSPTALSLPGADQPLAYEPEYSINTYEEVIEVDKAQRTK